MSDVFEHIELVKSGVKALDVLKHRPFDLILMDIDMPILNGVETTRQIRSSSSSSILPHNRDIPIVAVTTNDSDDSRQVYTKVGMVNKLKIRSIKRLTQSIIRMVVLVNQYH
ncbi:hypothetical protein G6F68_016031 [Rhizopus microsporus]|nr:hypothetical protein G6F68_016031 [Rhizopus microsporus]